MSDLRTIYMREALPSFPSGLTSIYLVYLLASLTLQDIVWLAPIDIDLSVVSVHLLAGCSAYRVGRGGRGGGSSERSY